MIYAGIGGYCFFWLVTAMALSAKFRDRTVSDFLASFALASVWPVWFALRFVTRLLRGV